MAYTRTKKLTDSSYSPTTPVNEAAIRTQIDGAIQEILDLLDAGKVDIANVLSLTNTTPYTPTANYHPSTKKYIDYIAAAFVLGAVSAGSITDSMLSNAAGQVKDAKLNKNGGTIQNYGEVVVTNATATGTVSLNITNGNVFNETLTGNTTFTFDNPFATGTACSFTLILNQGGTAYTVTWPASVKWSNDSIPDISTINKTTILSFMTLNGGTRWYGTASTKFTT